MLMHQSPIYQEMHVRFVGRQTTIASGLGEDTKIIKPKKNHCSYWVHQWSVGLHSYSSISAVSGSSVSIFLWLTSSLNFSQNWINCSSFDHLIFVNNAKNFSLFWESLKFVSAIFIKFLFFHQMIALQNLRKMFYISFRKFFSFSRYIQIFVFFSLLFHTFQTQEGKWKWNNLWCHELACINLLM